MPPPPLPRHWPHFTEGSPHRIAHTGGRRVMSLNLRVWMTSTPTICGHLAAVLLTQWTVIAVALRWVPPPTVGAIADGEWWDSTPGLRQSRGVLSAAMQTKTSRFVDLVCRSIEVYHTKVLSGTKKERNQWAFFVVKGILGQRYYELDYRKCNFIYEWGGLSHCSCNYT